MKKYSFNKEERLSGKKNISRLFSGGKYFFGENFKIIIDFSEENNSGIKIGISIPKRKIPKAVDRNLLKRRIREIVRLQKNQFLSSTEISKKNINIFIVFRSSKILKSSILEKDIYSIFKKINEHISTNLII